MKIIDKIHKSMIALTQIFGAKVEDFQSIEQVLERVHQENFCTPSELLASGVSELLEDLSGSKTLDSYWHDLNIFVDHFAPEHWDTLEKLATIADRLAQAPYRIACFLPSHIALNDAGKIALNWYKLQTFVIDDRQKSLKAHQRTGRFYLHPALTMQFPADLSEFHFAAAMRYSFGLYILNILSPYARELHKLNEIDKIRACSPYIPPEVPMLLAEVLDASALEPCEIDGCLQLCREIRAAFELQKSMNTHKPSLHLKTEFESYAVSGRFKRGAMQDGIMINYDLPEGLSIVGVADGVSTADLGSGESAVRILADVFEERAITYGRKLVDPNLWPEDAKLYLADTIEQANIEIVERWNLFLAQRTRPEAVEHPMSTTVVATIVLGDTAVIGWAGDSIAWHYEARTKRLYRLTIPHNNMTKHLSKGDLDILRRSPSGEDSHLIHIVGYGHFLPNSECFEPDRMEMDMLIRKFAENDLLILATDGLTECLHTTGELTRDMELEGLIANSMKKSDDLQSLCCKMVENADQQQGNDNISVLVMRFVPIPKPKPKQAQKCKTDNSQKMQ